MRKAIVAIRDGRGYCTVTKLEAGRAMRLMEWSRYKIITMKIRRVERAVQGKG